MVPVWLIRYVTFEGFPDEGGCYRRKATLPFPPFVGLGLPVDANNDPVNVESVWIEEAGGVAVLIEGSHYRVADDIAEKSTRDKQLEFHTAGWEKINLWRTVFPPFESGQIPWRLEGVS